MRAPATWGVSQYSGVLLLAALGAALLLLTHHFALLRGADTDLFPRWFGLRELLVHHRDPYAAAVTDEIVAHTSLAAAPSSLHTAYGFLYPLPGALLLAPLALLPYDWAAALWLALGLVALPLAVLVAARVPPAPGQSRVVSLALPLAFAFVPSWWSLALIQPALAVLGLTAAALSLARCRPTLAGASLAAAALLKPQMAGPLAVAWALYCLARSRAPASRALVVGLTTTTLLLTGLSSLLLPRWPFAFVEGARAYAAVPAMNVPTPALLYLPIPAPGAALGVALAVWTARGWWQDARASLPVPSRGITRTVIFTALLIPPAWETNALMLLLPLATLAGSLRGRAAVIFVATSCALSLALAPLPLFFPWRSGALTIAAYVLLYAAGQSLLTRFAAKPAAAAPAAPPTPAPPSPSPVPAP